MDTGLVVFADPKICTVMVTVAAAPLGHVSKVAMKRKLPSSGTMDGVEMLTVSTPFIAQLRSVALVVRDSNDNGGRA